MRDACRSPRARCPAMHRTALEPACQIPGCCTVLGLSASLNHQQLAVDHGLATKEKWVVRRACFLFAGARRGSHCLMVQFSILYPHIPSPYAGAAAVSMERTNQLINQAVTECETAYASMPVAGHMCRSSPEHARTSRITDAARLLTRKRHHALLPSLLRDPAPHPVIGPLGVATGRGDVERSSGFADP